MSRGERVQEMGIDHREFFRTLPRAMCGRPWSRDGLRVAVAVEGGDCGIEIGRLRSGFDRHDQRGGG